MENTKREHKTVDELFREFEYLADRFNCVYKGLEDTDVENAQGRKKFVRLLKELYKTDDKLKEVAHELVNRYDV